MTGIGGQYHRNIHYVALLAKIGGIPWRLARTREEEINIGIGAFKPQGAKHRFLGSAFCFSNEGILKASTVPGMMIQSCLQVQFNMQLNNL